MKRFFLILYLIALKNPFAFTPLSDFVVSGRMSIFHSDGNITKFTVFKLFQLVGMTFILAFCLNRINIIILQILFSKLVKKIPKAVKF